VNPPPSDELVGIELDARQPSGAAVGRVDDAPVGSAVLLGKRVLVPARDPCGQCDVCRRGGAAVCTHARARPPGHRIRASSRWIVALAGGLELPLPQAAAIPGDVATAYTLYARTGLAPREPVVVLGATPIARFLVDILRAKSIAPVAVAPPDDAWCDHLVRAGAAVVRDDRDDVTAAVAAAIEAHGLGARPWRVIATDASALPLAATLAGPRATLTVLAPASPAPEAIGADPPPLPGVLLAREVAIVGVAGAHPDLVVEAAALVARGEIDLVGGVEVVAEGEAARDRTKSTVAIVQPSSR
jgi:threonine dehydrogenase-like Zn-dependent dehydrogenase